MCEYTETVHVYSGGGKNTIKIQNMYTRSPRGGLHNTGQILEYLLRDCVLAVVC